MIAEPGGKSEVRSNSSSSGDRTELTVSGMTCQNCARHVRDAIMSVPEVDAADVELDAGTARVRWRSGAAPQLEAVLKELEEAGYPSAAKADTAPPRAAWASGWQFNVILGSLVTVPLIFLEWIGGVGMERWYRWLSFLLVLPVQILGGWRFYRGAWNQLKKWQSNMDTLVALGSTTAFLYSVWGLLSGWPGHLFFMDAAAIITLVSLGHYLEAKASARAGASLKALMQLAPDTARRLVNGSEQIVPASELMKGDRVRLKPGDRVPTDGEVVDGASSVNESMLTGESLPVEKARGAKVFAGTINESGQLSFEVTGRGDETALAQIIRIVERAQSSRADIQRLGDRVSSIFVPIVVVIALLTALWWGLAAEHALAVHSFLSKLLWQGHIPSDPWAAAILQAAAVLIIACPCAMGLATPIAIMAGTNAAAKRGILIRDGTALEKTGRLTAVIFDKTGTLTDGKLSIGATETLGTENPNDVEGIAASLARSSTHPLSKAIAARSSANISFSHWREIRGSGVEGALDDKVIRLGSLAWLASVGVDVEPASGFSGKWTSEGATVLGLAENNSCVAVFALRDSLKPHARKVVEELIRSDKTVYMVTGDNQRTALAIARQAGIPEANVFADVRPEGKVAVISDLQQRGERVAFAGDGINDAPALEQADLGIALLNASDVARESADIILLNADVEAIPEAIGLAQATLRTIKQNLFWAFFYNAAGVPLAALGFLSPIFSAFAMGMSDLIVVGNALRLGAWKPRRSSRP